MVNMDFGSSWAIFRGAQPEKPLAIEAGDDQSQESFTTTKEKARPDAISEGPNSE